MDQVVTDWREPARQAGLLAMNANKVLAQPEALSTVLERLHNNESVPEIAESLGITDIALYAFLMRNAPEQWKSIQAAKAIAKLDRTDNELDSCTSGIELGRARERIGLAKWTAERTCRPIYGQNIELTGKDGKNLIPEQNPADLARQIIFLMRKGIEAEDAVTIDGATQQVQRSIEDK